MFAGQVIVGGWVSSTNTSNEQEGVPPATVQVTVVAPTGKNEPDAGTQVTAPHVPVAVGAG
jgi:hypothetical protein